MLFYFAYGSNMSPTLMRTLAPRASAVGPARLVGWQFRITRCGYASVVRKAGSMVHGVLWRLSARELPALDRYEDVSCGTYVRHVLAVRYGAYRRPAWVYVARDPAVGRPRPGYRELVVAAAREWQLPADYVDELTRCLPEAASSRPDR